MNLDIFCKSPLLPPRVLHVPRHPERSEGSHHPGAKLSYEYCELIPFLKRYLIRFVDLKYGCLSHKTGQGGRMWNRA